MTAAAALALARGRDRRSPHWQEQVLPLSLPLVAVKAAHPDFWRRYVGRQGAVAITIRRVLGLT